MRAASVALLPPAFAGGAVVLSWKPVAALAGHPTWAHHQVAAVDWAAVEWAACEREACEREAGERDAWQREARQREAGRDGVGR